MSLSFVSICTHTGPRLHAYLLTSTCPHLLQGLGKTLQTISLVAYLREYRGIKGYHMVVVPKSTMHNWCNEFRRFCPCIKVVKFHGNQEERVSLCPVCMLYVCVLHVHVPVCACAPVLCLPAQEGLTTVRAPHPLVPPLFDAALHQATLPSCWHSNLIFLASLLRPCISTSKHPSNAWCPSSWISSCRKPKKGTRSSPESLMSWLPRTKWSSSEWPQALLGFCCIFANL